MGATFIQFASGYPKCVTACKVEVAVESLDPKVATVTFLITQKGGGVASCVPGPVTIPPAPPAPPTKWALTYDCPGCTGKQYTVIALARNQKGELLKGIRADTNVCPR